MIWTEHPLIDALPQFRKLSDEQFAALAGSVGPAAALEYFKAREKRIAEAARDPFRHEFPLAHWADVEHLVQQRQVVFVPGGNNPGKSWWAGSLGMRFLTRRFGWEGQSTGKLRVLYVAQDEDASAMFQQPAVYAHFPVEWRNTNESQKKPPGFAKLINYGEKNGFTEGSFVLPKPLKGQCWFKTVAQYTRDPKSFEGPAYDLVIVDEGCPLPLFNSLLGRVSKLGGRLIYLLTCVNGYDPTMGQGLEGATLTKTLPMRWDFTQGIENFAFVFPELRLQEHQSEYLKRLGCPVGHMPYLMQPLNPNWGVIFMWNTFNPFQPPGKWVANVKPPMNTDETQIKNHSVCRLISTPWQGKMPAMFDAAVGKPRWKVLVMLFGWIERVGQLAIGNFNPEVHVVRGERREALDAMIRDGKATVYTGSDPETARSHAILWLAVFPPSPTYPKGLKYLFDESPRRDEGEWVNAAGERGDGQYVYRATGSNWYKKYIRDRERDWNICDLVSDKFSLTPPPATVWRRVVSRRGDPRGFATEESTATGTRSLFNLYLENHAADHPDLGPMIFEPARVRAASTLDLDIIIDLLKYDEDKAASEGGVSAENCPQLLISDRCENFIRCALNYTLTDTGKGDAENPNKDFIDAARYLLSMDTPWVDVESAGESGGGAWS